jgi:phage tail sheath gpL-like
MPDNITFLSIPTDWRVPGAWLEIDHTHAVRGLPGMPRRILLLGQRLASGSVAEGVLTRVTRKEDGVNYFGRGSMLAQMIPAALKVNPASEMWALALDDNAAGQAAAGAVTFGGSPTAAGTLNAYIGGTRVQTGISVGQTPAAIATAFAAAINAALDLAVTAAVDGVDPAKVNLTARHKGEEGNGIDVRVNYYVDETTPAGLTATVTAMSGGTANPDVLEAIAAMSSGAYYTIIMPWTDAANVTALESELQSRWGGLDMRTGHLFGCRPGTYSQLATYGSARNSPHSSLFGLKRCPSLPWVNAAQWGAAIEFSGANDPAVPFKTIPLPDVMAPAEADRFTDTERNLLLHDGISTVTFDQAGRCLIEQVVTTYQTNAAGLEDVSLLKLNTKWTVDYMRYAFRFAVVRDYPAHKLAGDDVLGQIAAGQNIATPKLIRNTLIATAGKLAEVGLLEDLEQFKRDLLVVRSETDKNRVNAIIPPNTVNQFDVFAASVQFIL